MSCVCSSRGTRRDSRQAGGEGRSNSLPSTQLQANSQDSHRSRGGGGTHTQPRAQTTNRCTVGHMWNQLLPTCPPTLWAGSPSPNLRAHNLAGPRLVGRVGGQLGEHHLDGLELLVLGWDGAHLVGDLIALHRHVLALDAGGGEGKSGVRRATPHNATGAWAWRGGRYEALALGK